MAIIQFFRIIIEKFLARDTHNLQLTSIAANLFEWNHSLHSQALQGF
jgi:hypothetical protein